MWMVIEGSLQPSVMQGFQESLGLGNQRFIPRVACPAGMSDVFSLDQVPIHVDNSNRKRNAVILELVHQRDIFCLFISVISAPPIPKTPSGHLRLSTRNRVK